jgi:two-component system, OmpR family, response regulator ResD
VPYAESGIRSRADPADPSPVEALRILVVDDDPAVGGYVCAVLRQAGHDVHSAADLARALEVAGETRLDLLVSDVVLGPVDGLDVEEAVRVVQPSVKTIFMSGYARPRFKTGSEDPVLSKPFAPRDLLERVDDLFPS